MPGSADLDPDVLIDDLVSVADELRRDVVAGFGLRPFRVTVVVRQWSAAPGAPGATYTETRTELDPPPKVEPFSGYHYRLEPCGLDEAGSVRLSEISLSYTEAELGAGSGDGLEAWYEIAEAHGQATSTRRFVLKRPPFPDRVKTLGWRVELVHAETLEAVEPGGPPLVLGVVTGAGDPVVNGAGEPIVTTEEA